MKAIDKLVDNLVIATILMVVFTVCEVLMIGWFFAMIGETFVIDAALAAGTTIFNYLLAAIVMIGEALKHHE